jgi:hypothetical protein
MRFANSRRTRVHAAAVHVVGDADRLPPMQVGVHADTS